MKSIRAIYIFLGLLLCFTTLLNAKAHYKYSYAPKKVYENQIFPITVIDINKSTKEEPSFSFSPKNNLKSLFKKPLIIQNGNDSFYTFYFKAQKNDAYINLKINNSSSKQIKLPTQNISIKKLKKRKDFCHVLASDFKIKNSQVSIYDEKNLIVTLSLEAYEANLENMTLENVLESGIESLKRNFAKVSAEFYAVVPKETKLLKFTYFNTIKNQYVFKKVPVIIKDASVSTQTDLNPKEDSFEKLKKYTLMTLLGFFFLMFLLKRDFFYLVFFAISFITLLTLYVPHKKICISEGAELYILPTNTSTISTNIDTQLDTVLLGERKGYKKVEYKNGIIGWVKNENICKN